MFRDDPADQEDVGAEFIRGRGGGLMTIFRVSTESTGVSLR